MKYICKLTIFMVLGLLLVSCGKSSSKANNESNNKVIVRGVLEKGKATDALCTIKTLDGKIYAKSNYIDNGGYIAYVPVGAFGIYCMINEYIDDNTGNEITPNEPIVLEAISFAKAGENKTVNVNVITDLLAKELEENKNKITDETSFDIAQETVRTKILTPIENVLQYHIDDLDTLHLDRTANNILTQLSLAIQTQLDKADPQVTTVQAAFKKILHASNGENIIDQDVSNLNPRATGIQLSESAKPSDPIQSNNLAGAMIGGKPIETSPIDIDLSKEVAFSVPIYDLGEVAASNSIYITSNKLGMTIPIKLEGGKNALYMASDIRDLFKTNGVTTFTLCVVPTMRILDTAANRQCQSTSIQTTFKATAAGSTDSGTDITSGIDIGVANGAGAPATGESTQE